MAAGIQVVIDHESYCNNKIKKECEQKLRAHIPTGCVEYSLTWSKLTKIGDDTQIRWRGSLVFGVPNE